jgi:hypothetical protein
VINDDDAQTSGRNLMFNAGTAVAYGLTKEQALQSITLNAAKALGVEKQTGSIEVGKGCEYHYQRWRYPRHAQQPGGQGLYPGTRHQPR